MIDEGNEIQVAYIGEKIILENRPVVALRKIKRRSLEGVRK